MRKNDEAVYCRKRKCPHRSCLRHYFNAPFDRVIRVREFTPDKDWNCEDRIDDNSTEEINE